MKLFQSSSDTIAEIVVSDTHVGEKYALMYPDTNSDYQLNDWQKWLWKVWNGRFLPSIEKTLEKWKATYVHFTTLGDMGSLQYKHGHPSSFWAHTESAVTMNTAQLFDPLVKMADAMHCIHGNDAHIGPNGKLDHMIAEDFDNVIPFKPEKGMYAHPSVDLEFQGLLFNYTHKGRNRTKWTSVNGLTSLSKEVALDRTLKKQRVPDVIGRAHFHFGWQLRDIYPLVFTLAGWKLKDDYTTYIDPVDESPHVGGQVLIIKDGQIVDSQCLTYMMERSKPWSVK